MYNCIVPFYKAEKCFVGLEEKFKSIKLFHSLNFLWHLILRLVWVRMPENVSVRRRMPAILVPPPLCKQFTFFSPQIIVAVSIDFVNYKWYHFLNYKTASCQFSPHFDSFDKQLQSLGMLDVFETNQHIWCKHQGVVAVKLYLFVSVRWMLCAPPPILAPGALLYDVTIITTIITITNKEGKTLIFEEKYQF